MTSEHKMTFWHSQLGIFKKIKATARNIFPGAPDPQVLYTFSFGTNWCPSNLKTAPTGLVCRPGGGGVHGLRTYGDVPLKNLKSSLSRSQIPENDTLSRRKIFLNNTLSFSFFGQSCALQGNLYEINRKMWKYCHLSDLNHIRRVKMASNDLSDSKLTNMDPVVEPIFTKMIPCPGVGILKMIPCSAARPRAEKYMSTPRVCRCVVFLRL